MKIVIVNYGLGNIKSIISALTYIGVYNIHVSYDHEELASSDKLILPGVGSFSEAMHSIQQHQLDTHLYDLVIMQKKPILGICLGMQLMGLSSTEHGTHPGLGFIPGEISRLNDYQVKVPHVGFNQVNVNNGSKLYSGLSGMTDFYFTHSYKMISSDDINQCFCDYSEPFIASYEVSNIVGVQFHPELSQNNGLKLLKNFIERC